MTRCTDQGIDDTLIALTEQLLAESGETRQVPITLTASLQRHVGIDSLTRAELFKRIEKTFDVTLPDRLLMEVDTLKDIAIYLHDPAHLSPTHRQQFNKTMTSVAMPAAIDVNVATAQSLLDVLQRYAKAAPDKIHIYFQHESGQEERITYQSLLIAAKRVAQGLHNLGLKEGETVAIMLPTQPEFFYTYFGVLFAGGIPVPIYPPFRMHMLEAYAKTEAVILNNAQVRILVTFAQASALSRVLQTFVPSLKHVVTATHLLQHHPIATPFVAKLDHFAFIQYTSGSTAYPKGVLLTHANLIENIRAYGKAIAVKPDDVAVSWLPLYHDMGLIGMWLGSLYYGIPLVLLTPFSFLNHPEKWLWAIHRYRGTLSGAPNFAYELCVRKIDNTLLEGLDLSCWRMAANGAEKIYPATLEQFANKFKAYGFKDSALLPVYGLAESTVALAIPPLHQSFQVDYVARKAFEEKRLANPVDKHHAHALAFVNCGKAIDQHAIRVVDDHYQVLPDRHIGNIQFSGPSSMQGYFNNPEATAAIYHDGWWDTGDLGYLVDGAIYITGRHKDLIIKAGRNLYPAEIEEMVGGVPGVRQGCVAAFGVTDAARGTEQLIVVAETRETNKKTRMDIQDAINNRIATTLDLVPDAIILVKPHTVPKTSSGKLQRAACKKMYNEHRLQDTHTPPWLQIVKLGLKSVLHKIIAAFTWIAKAIVTFYVILLVLLTFWFVYPMVRFTKPLTARRVIRWWLSFLIHAAGCRLSVINKEKMITDKAVVYVANHASYLDGLILLITIPVSLRLVAKKELFNVPILRTFLRQLGCVALDRNTLPQGIEDTKQIELLLKENQSVLIFPEGTFGYAEGLRPFRLGAFKIAADTSSPVCPLAIAGTRQIWRDDEYLIRPGKIEITVCELLIAASNEWQAITSLRNEARDAIAKYCGEPSLDFIIPQIVAESKRR